MKFLHDEEARLIHAREEGADAGKVQLLQQLLGEPEQSIGDLLQLNSDTLASLLADLQQRLRTRNG
ncbi:hypothetical protein [Rubripirellula obstinata]|nr:hypothetical protein [Rubripirellula obstinata]